MIFVSQNFFILFLILQKLEFKSPKMFWLIKTTFVKGGVEIYLMDAPDSKKGWRLCGDDLAKTLYFGK